MSGKDSSSRMDTNVDSEHREATPAEGRKIGLVGMSLVRLGIVAVLCGAVIVFGCAMAGLIKFS